MKNKVFISYSYLDADIARQLQNALISSDIEVAPNAESLYSEQDLSNNIKEDLLSSSLVLLLVSDNYAKSQWAAFERGAAYALNKKILAIVISNNNLPEDIKQFNQLNLKTNSHADLVSEIQKYLQPENL